jgi:hypothetical protein
LSVLKMNKQLREKLMESLSSVLPITAIVLILSITITPLEPGMLVLFLFGAFLLVAGMSFFTMGVDISMTPMGEGMGVQLSHSKRITTPLTVAFILGVLITAAEPDLQILATQVPSIPNPVLIFTVAVGVGLFLMLAVVRTLFKIKVSHLLLFFYLVIFIFSYFVPNDFIPVSFDSGGVTTGPITVPFIMALGIGMASVRSDRRSRDDSFGLVAICSIGPVLSVLLLGICFEPDSTSYAVHTSLAEVTTTADAARAFATALPAYIREVAIAMVPICVLFLLFQLITRRFHRHQLLKILTGLIYTYLGLVLFLTGVNVGFMPAGEYIGASVAQGSNAYLLIPIGMLMGYYIVVAEPAVHVLTKQVEEVSNGSITQKSMRLGLSIGVSISVGIAMLRVLTGISILWFLIPGYALSLGLTFFVPQIYTCIAFDSGGVASGPMTATFLLPFAMGACEASGGNIMTDAFGIVAMVAMTPLVTIQLLGITSKLKTYVTDKVLGSSLDRTLDCVLYYDE